MKSKTMILMVVAVVCGLVASYLTSQLIAQKNAMVTVVVPRKAITQWTPIRDPEGMFEVKQWPQADAPNNPVQDLKLLKDRVCLKDLEADKPVAENMLQSKDKVGLEGMLEPKTRAMAIVVNAAATAGGFVQPGSKVDVMHTIRTGTLADTKLVLENVLVRAVDLQPVRPEDKVGMIPQTVTLQLTPEQALKLGGFIGNGTLTLLLRPFGDTSVLSAKDAPVLPNAPDPNKVAEDRGPKRKKGIIQTIVNGQGVKTSRFQKGDKGIYQPDTDTTSSYDSPTGDSEGK
jgi:pilus assembly protein CpaB